jgi:hypothetical protein
MPGEACHFQLLHPVGLIRDDDSLATRWIVWRYSYIIDDTKIYSVTPNIPDTPAPMVRTAALFRLEKVAMIACDVLWNMKMKQLFVQLPKVVRRECLGPLLV